MNVKLQSSYKKITAYLLTLSLSVYVGWIILQPWQVETRINNLLAGEDIQKKPLFKPKKADYYYLLGRYFQYSPLLRDFQEAKDYYIQAIRLNPVKAEYWIDLAKIEDALDNPLYAARAMNRALSLKPAGLNVHWESTNLWLKREDTTKALNSLKVIVHNYPQERHRAFPLLWLAAQGDLDVVMKEAIPDETEAKVGFLWHLIGRGKKREALQVWHSLSTEDLQPSVRLQYIDQLISWGDVEDAKKEWKDLKGEKEGRNNLVWNGSFEESNALNHGFDWKIGEINGSEITIDDDKAKEGRRSLRIDFNGEENVNFHHVYQTVPLEPERQYILSASVKSNEITTTNGVKFDVTGLYGCKFYQTTETLTGTNPWKELSIEIETPEDCKAGMIRVRREKSAKFNNSISGTIWIDDVRIEKIPSD